MFFKYNPLVLVMLSIFLEALRAHLWLRYLLIAFVTSAIGNGFTYIVVFSELIALEAAPSALALVFVLAVAPGLLGVALGERLLKYMDAVHCIVLGEAVSFIGLVIPFLGVARHDIALLQGAECIASIAGSMTLPAMSHYIKAQFSERELPAAVVIQTFVMTGYTFLGVGVGALICQWVNNFYLLAIDALSYVVSIVLLMRLPKLATDFYAIQVESLPQTLSLEQKMSVWLFPFLSSVTCPAMALLPSLAQTDMVSHQTVIPILFARSLGQLLGPFFVKKGDFAHFSSRLTIICLIAFVGCYATLAFSHWLLLSFSMIAVAHIFSNIVVCHGQYGLLKHFKPEHVAAASALSFKKQTLIVAFTASLAGILADYIGSLWALCLCSGFGLIATLVMLYRLRWQ